MCEHMTCMWYMAVIAYGCTCTLLDACMCTCTCVYTDGLVHTCVHVFLQQAETLSFSAKILTHLFLSSICIGKDKSEVDESSLQLGGLLEIAIFSQVRVEAVAGHLLVLGWV